VIKKVLTKKFLAPKLKLRRKDMKFGKRLRVLEYGGIVISGEMLMSSYRLKYFLLDPFKSDIALEN